MHAQSMATASQPILELSRNDYDKAQRLLRSPSLGFGLRLVLAQAEVEKFEQLAGLVPLHRSGRRVVPPLYILSLVSGKLRPPMPFWVKDAMPLLRDAAEIHFTRSVFVGQTIMCGLAITQVPRTLTGFAVNFTFDVRALVGDGSVTVAFGSFKIDIE